jgi:hypothetical protein
MLSEKVAYFAHRTQEQWGISAEYVSPLGWRSAIFILSSLEHNLIPAAQLQVLTRAVKAIYSEFKFAILPKLEAEGKTGVCIAADDLVPIFIFIFCQCKLQHPLQNRDMMWQLCHPDSLHGEGGYYLTVYESAIEFVLNEPMERAAFIGNEFLPSDSRPQPRTKSQGVVSVLSSGIQGILAFNDKNNRYSMQSTFV